jgi:Flp pilus assembly protein TadG
VTPMRARNDRGSAAVELALLAPVAIALLCLLAAGFRISIAGDRITGVAASAARDASIARSPGDAQTRAAAGAQAALLDVGFDCTNVAVNVDTSGFAAAPGVPATVRVDVSCTVPLADLGLPGLPGSKTLTDHAVSPLDPARDSP